MSKSLFLCIIFIAALGDKIVATKLLPEIFQNLVIKEENLACPICMDDLEAQSGATINDAMWYPCKHYICHECFAKYNKNLVCSICRARAKNERCILRISPIKLGEPSMLLQWKLRSSDENHMLELLRHLTALFHKNEITDELYHETINALDSEGKPLLYHALLKNWRILSQSLLEAGADTKLLIPIFSSNNPESLVVFNNFCGLQEKGLSENYLKNFLSQRDNEDRSPLFRAITLKQHNLAYKMIEAGALEYPLKKIEMLAIIALQETASIPYSIQLLIAKAYNYKGQSILHYAMKIKCYSLVRDLLKARATPDILLWNIETATEGEVLELLRCLKKQLDFYQYNALISYADHQNKTIFHYAKSKHWEQVEQELNAPFLDFVAQKQTWHCHWFPMQERRPYSSDNVNNLYAPGGALEKHDQVTGKNAQAYERTYNHKPYGDPGSKWFGHGDYASNVACLLPKVKRAVVYGGIKFRIIDIQGLLVKAVPNLVSYNVDFVGQRKASIPSNLDTDLAPYVMIETLKHWSISKKPFVMSTGSSEVWPYPFDNVKIHVSNNPPQGFEPKHGKDIYYYRIEASGTEYLNEKCVLNAYVEYDSSGNVISSNWIKTSDSTEVPDFLWRPHPIGDVMDKATWVQRERGNNPEIDMQTVYEIFMKSIYSH